MPLLSGYITLETCQQKKGKKENKNTEEVLNISNTIHSLLIQKLPCGKLK